MVRLARAFGIWCGAERGRFVLWLPVAALGGVLAYFALASEPPPWLAWAMPAMAGAALALAWRWPLPRGVAALALAVALGFARAQERTAALPPLTPVAGVHRVEGIVADLRIGADGERLILAAPRLDDAPPLARSIRVKRAAYDTAPLAPGETVALKARLFAPDRPSFPGAHDFGRDAYFEGLGGVGYVLGRVLVVTPARGGASFPAARLAIAAHIAAVLPVDTGSVATTLLTGGEQAIPAPERAAFVAAGLAHLLAVAGLHVGIVMGIAALAARLAFSLSERANLLLPRNAAIAAVALLAGFGYAALTGAHLPILRSVAMASLFTAGVLFGRRSVSLRGLALAAAVIIAATPEQVLGASFQMSFSAVLALIAGYSALRAPLESLAAYLRRKLGWPGVIAFVLAEIGLTSLLAGGASMLFAAADFQRVQPYWVLANLIAVPLTALWVMPCGLLALATMPFGLDRLPLLAMGAGLRPIVAAARWVAGLPGASIAVPPMPAWAVILFAFGLCWLCLWRTRPRLAGIALMAAGIAGAVLGASSPDFVIAPDAKLIAIRTGAQITIYAAKGARPMVRDEILSLWPGLPAAETCAPAGCAAVLAGHTVIVTPQAPTTCPQAMLLIVAVPARLDCEPGAPWLLDRFSVWHDGAIAGWIAPNGLRLTSDRLVQGSRPWVPAWPDWRYGAGGRAPIGSKREAAFFQKRGPSLP